MLRKLLYIVVGLLALIGAFGWGALCGQYKIFPYDLMNVYMGTVMYYLPSYPAAGGKLFRAHCASCHGIDGAGGLGPDLTRAPFRYATNDRALRQVIARGIEGTEMPRLPLPGTDVGKIVAYVKSLRQAQEEPNHTQLQEDVLRGNQLFHGPIGCGQCHMINGKGGRLGPDLSDIGSVRSLQYLLDAMIEPDAQISHRYRTVRVIDQQGNEVQGLLKDEDTYSLRLLDLGTNLRSYWKADLQEIIYEKHSLMPSYKETLSTSDLHSLASYLYSLRR